MAGPQKKLIAPATVDARLWPPNKDRCTLTRDPPADGAGHVRVRRDGHRAGASSAGDAAGGREAL